METTFEHRSPRSMPRWSMWAGIGVVLVVVIANAMIRRMLPPDATSLALVAGIGVAGLAAIGSLYARMSFVPRWGWVGAGLVMGVALVIGAVLAEPSREGTKDVSELAWLFTWMLVMFGWFPAQSSSAACARTANRLGWIVIASAAFLSAVMLVVPRLLDAMRLGMVL